MTLALNRTLVRNNDLLTTNVDGDLVMLSVDAGKYYSINTTGHQIWKMLEHPTSPQSICEALANKFKIEPKLIEQDVLPFLEQLLECQILKTCPDSI